MIETGNVDVDESYASARPGLETGRYVQLRVTDDGREREHRPAGGSGGYGLVGMRERVALLHGRLSAGRHPEGGWRVEAWLPLEGDS